MAPGDRTLVMIGRLLENLEPSTVRVVRCPTVGESIAQWRRESDRPGRPARTVLCVWRRLPAVGVLLEETLHALARTALALWPHWYPTKFGGQGKPTSFGDASEPQGPMPEQVLRPWFQAAAACCRQEKLPRPDGFAAAIEARQLALALERLHLVLCTEDAQADTDRLYSLARAAEWLAKETAARVVVLVPKAVGGAAALDSISYGALDWPTPPAPSPTPDDRDTEEKAGLLVWPFLGRPHPDSPGEQLLAARLQADSELAGLFAFNQELSLPGGPRYIVDLLWRQGRLAVEVDGYRWHSDPATFRQDRHRDYELLLQGFVVLRLTHDEVVADVASAIEKIRRVAAYCRGKMMSESQSPGYDGRREKG